MFVVLLAAPVLFVWPRPAGRLVPRRWRRRLIARPLAGPLLIAAPVTVFVSAVWSVLVPRSADQDRSAGHVVVVVVLITLIFGGITAAAIVRAVRAWIFDWSLTDISIPAPAPCVAVEWADMAGPQPPVTAYPSTNHAGELARPVGHRRDRQLRNASRWLTSAGVSWYLLGRVLQVTRHGSSVPGWWWVVTLALLLTGGCVWVARRSRWRAAGRSSSPRASAEALAQLAADYNLALHRPAGEWVRSWAPIAFIPNASTSGPSQWPWAATGTFGGARLLAAVQYARMTNRAGLTTRRTRTSCAVRLPGARLPRLTICEREAIPPASRHQSIALELEAFNRSLWVWGPDARGVYDILHPRAMTLALQSLPDGSRVHVAGDTIAVVTDEPVSPTHLRSFVVFAQASVGLLPSYLRPNR